MGIHWRHKSVVNKKLLLSKIYIFKSLLCLSYIILLPPQPEMYYIGVYFSLKPQYNSVCINLNLQLIEIDYYNKKRNQSGKKLYNTIGNITKNT